MAMKQLSRQRGSKMNAVQRDYLIDFMCTNPNFAAGRFEGPMGHESSAKTWAMLAHDLNLKGPDKGIDQWKKVWADIKSKTRSKVAEIRAEHNKTGNIVNDRDVPLSDSDKKVIAIIGEAGVEGLRGVADSLPDSVKSLRKLMAGNESGLLDDIDEFSVVAICGNQLAEEGSNDDSRRAGIEAKAGPSGAGQADGEPGPSSQPATSAEKKGKSRTQRDGRVLELLEEQNKILKGMARNGEALNELLREIVAIKRRKLALLETSQAAE